jgi:deoxyuridine 5'-triphosphate nucleotidohydrolase
VSRIYLMGPMSGLPDDNYPAFEEAARQLRAIGYVVVSPHEGGATAEEIAMSKELGAAFRDTPEYAAILKRTVAMMVTCDAIAQLPGWEESRGSQREMSVARLALMQARPIAWFLENPPCSCDYISWSGRSDCMPMRGKYQGDAGFDLVVAESVVIRFGDSLDVPMGVQVQMPPGLWAMIIGRSSTLRSRGLLVQTNVIDNGYRGDLFAMVQNMSSKTVTVERGERIAQLIPLPLVSPTLGLVNEALKPSDRGDSAFGSTGL